MSLQDIIVVSVILLFILAVIIGLPDIKFESDKPKFIDYNVIDSHGSKVGLIKFIEQPDKYVTRDKEGKNERMLYKSREGTVTYKNNKYSLRDGIDVIINETPKLYLFDLPKIAYHIDMHE